MLDTISQQVRDICLEITGIGCTCISSVAGFAGGVFSNSVVQNQMQLFWCLPIYWFFFLLRLWLTYNYFCHCACFAASVLHDMFTLSHLGLCGIFLLSIFQIFSVGLNDSCFCWTLLTQFTAFTTVCFQF